MVKHVAAVKREPHDTARVDGRAERRCFAVDKFLRRGNGDLIDSATHTERGIKLKVAVRFNLGFPQERLGEIAGCDTNVVSGRFEFQKLIFTFVVSLNSANLCLSCEINQRDGGTLDHGPIRIGDSAPDGSSDALCKSGCRREKRAGHCCDETHQKARLWFTPMLCKHPVKSHCKYPRQRARPDERPSLKKHFLCLNLTFGSRVTFKLYEAGANKQPEDVLGENGLLKKFTKALLERAMQVEMAEHLGYEKHDAAGGNSGNSRNGTSEKTLKGVFGVLPIEVPPDRNSEFEPKIVPKGKTRLDGCRNEVEACHMG